MGICLGSLEYYCIHIFYGYSLSRTMLWKFGPFDVCLYIFSARVGFPKYQDVRTEEGADLEGVSLSKAECRLIEVYVDTINTNFY